MTHISGLILLCFISCYASAASFQNEDVGDELDIQNIPQASEIETDQDFDQHNDGTKEESFEEKVLRGDQVSPHSFTFMAALFRKNNNGYSFSCGGSIIGPRHILTAAHCIEPLSANGNHTAVLGLHNMKDRNEKGRQVVYFKKSNCIIHPEYNNQELENDIAIIKVDREIKATSTVNNICLTSIQESATVAGWGRTTCDDYKSSNVLLQASGTAVENAECEEKYRNTGASRRFPESQICMEMKPQSSLHGDSGGPLFITNDDAYQQVGIVSGGHTDDKGCPILEAPAYYTRVDQYRDFVSSIAGETTFCN